MGNGQWKAKGRVPLSNNAFIILNNTKIICEECIGRGSSCLVYRGRVSSGNDIIADTDVIIKEFYPKSGTEVFDIIREGGTEKLKVSNMTKKTSEYESKFEQFQLGIKNQKRLSKSDAMEIAIKPWMEGRWGDSYYVVSDSHKGTDLSRAVIDTLEKKLRVAIGVAESMDILHDAGFIMLDIKPDNLMWIPNPSTIRIVDVDSIVNLEDIENIDKTLLSNLRYASPEIHLLNRKVEERFVGSQLRNARKDSIQRDSNLYSIGIYLYELFWGKMPSFATIEKVNTEALLQQFVEIFAKDASVDEYKVVDIGKKMIDIIGKTVIENRTKRRKEGFKTAEALMKALNEIYAMLTSEKYISRKEIAKANGTFAAYNLLQKRPLFQYITKDSHGNKKLEVVLAGNHAMRKDMLSAVISIGQMLDTQLHIYVVSKDADYFWADYVSKEQNYALSDAVILSKNGKIISDTINPVLVARPLAHIHLMTKEIKNVFHRICQQGAGKYFILLDENIEKREEHYLALRNEIISKETAEKHFVGYLQGADEKRIAIDDASSVIDTYVISSSSYSATYNEKMFAERIYKMGLMASAYYCGFMEEDANVDMDALEASFKKDVYGMASSERSALHGMYKVASLGIDRNKPGRCLNFYKKLQDSEILEKLAWLEHLSWTGYLLTTGAVPVFTKESDLDFSEFKRIFDEYAYLENNDWKDRSDKEHLRHPFLVASHLERKMTNEMWKDTLSDTEVRGLDPLDRMSYRIYHWYMDKKENVSKQLEHLQKVYIESYPDENEEIQLMQELFETARRCILEAGKEVVSQKKTYVYQWNNILNQAKTYVTQKENNEFVILLKELESMMKPILDSYNDRDLKKLDRDLVFAALDMMV